MSIHEKFGAVLEAARGHSGAATGAAQSMVVSLLEELAKDAEQWESDSRSHVEASKRAIEEQGEVVKAEMAALAEEKDKLSQGQCQLADLVDRMQVLLAEIDKDRTEQQKQAREARAAAEAEKSALRAERAAVAAERERQSQDDRRQTSELVDRMQDLRAGMEADRAAAAKERQDARSRAEADMRESDATRIALEKKSGVLEEREATLGRYHAHLESQRAEVKQREADLAQREADVGQKETDAGQREAGLAQREAEVVQSETFAKAKLEQLGRWRDGIQNVRAALDEQDVALARREADLQNGWDQVRLREVELDEQAATAEARFLAKERELEAWESECEAKDAQRNARDLLVGHDLAVEQVVEDQLSSLESGLNVRFDHLKDLVGATERSTDREIGRLKDSVHDTVVVMGEIKELAKDVTEQTSASLRSFKSSWRAR